MRFRTLCACALAIAGVSAAQADSGWLGITAMGWQQAPGWFVAPGVEGGIQRLPRWNSTVSYHVPAAINAPQVGRFSHTPNLRGAEGGLTIGYVFKDGVLPPWLGRHVRVGLTGTWQSFSDTASNQFVAAAAPSTVIQYAGIDGRTFLPFVATGSSISESLRINRRGFDFNLRMASDIVLSPDWTLTPSFAAFAGRVHDTYNYRNAFGGFIFYDIDERVRTTSYGGEVSAGLTWRATSFLALSATARGGAVWMRSRLDGSDCFAFATLPCVPTFLSGPASPSSATVTDSRSRLGFRGGVSLGASLDMRFGILALGGFFTFDSAIPGIANPSLARATSAATGAGPARIRFANGIRYGAFGTLRIPLLFGM